MKKINWKETAMDAVIVASVSALGYAIYEAAESGVKAMVKKNKKKKKKKAA